MGKINLYKIDNIIDFIEDLNDNYEEFFEGTKIIESFQKNRIYDMKLYYKEEDEKKKLQWEWVFDEFKKDKFRDEFDIRPKAILLIRFQSTNENNVPINFCNDDYAVSFGQAYHTIDKYANKDWVFEIVKRLNYEQLRTMAVTMPMSRNNRRLNTYYGNTTLDWSSAELITNLKAKINIDTLDLPYKNLTFDETVQMGNSLNVKIKEDKLECIAKLIDFTHDILKLNVQYENLPHFKKITNKNSIANLEKKLNQKFKEVTNNSSLDYDLDILEYKVTESGIDFINQEVLYIYDINKIQFKSDKTELLNLENLIKFVKRVQEEYPEEKIDILNIHIEFVTEDGKTHTNNIKKFIFFTDNESNIILIDGTWNGYDNNYIKYLNDSIRKINVESLPEYDLNSKNYFDFVNDDTDSKEFTEEKFNQFISKECEYTLFDQKIEKWEDYKVEKMDLYDPKENIFIAVKVGNSSSKLSYVFDQCINGLIYLEHEEPEKYEKIKKVCIWIVYDKENTNIIKNITFDENGKRKVDLTCLNLLIVKTRLDEWKKEVSLRGFEPLVRINFKLKSKIKAFKSK